MKMLDDRVASQFLIVSLYGMSYFGIYLYLECTDILPRHRCIGVASNEIDFSFGMQVYKVW